MGKILVNVRSKWILKTLSFFLNVSFSLNLCLLNLKVTNKVLIPRSETELIVDIIFNIFRKKSEKLFFAELGTGSGAISIALALAYPLSEVVATDIDQDALEIATENYISSSKHSNLKFYCGNWWSPLESFKGKLDFVISNPPYIPRDTYKKLSKAVKNFEPKVALLGGEDGLQHFREIIQKAPLFLKENGWLILENHFDQSEKVKQLLIKNEFTSIEICLLYTSPSPRDNRVSRMPSSA